MTVEADLIAALQPACPRVFPDFAPVNTPRPYVTFQQVGGKVINPLSNALPDKQNGDFQVSVWADTRKNAAATALAIEAAIRAATAFTGRPLSGPVADYDADIPVYWTRQDFSIWSTR